MCVCVCRNRARAWYVATVHSACHLPTCYLRRRDEKKSPSRVHVPAPAGTRCLTIVGDMQAAVAATDDKGDVPGGAFRQASYYALSDGARKD